MSCCTVRLCVCLQYVQVFLSVCMHVDSVVDVLEWVICVHARLYVIVYIFIYTHTVCVCILLCVFVCVENWTGIKPDVEI